MVKLNVKVMTIALIAAFGLLSACNGDAYPFHECSASISSASQTGNTFTATGRFNGGQPLLRLAQGSNTYFATPINNTSTSADFDITGIPKGVYTANWDISCDNSSATPYVTSGVPTITIK